MAFIALNRNKLKKNYLALDNVFKKHNIEWAVVSKLLCGEKSYIQELVKLGAKQFCDSRISNLKTIKSISTEVETIYI